MDPVRRAAGLKAAASKGPEELSRAGKMAAWTRRHGKDDSRNPYARRKPATEPSPSKQPKLCYMLVWTA